MSNARPKALLTREIPDKAIEFLRTRTDLELNEKPNALSKEELIQRLSGKEGVLCTVADQIDDEVLAASSELKVVANFGVGYNNIDVDAATRRGILVTNTPGTLTETTADIAFALMLDVARRISEGDRLVRARKWVGWSPMQMLGTDVHGATLGLIGLGRIGKAMVPRARGFQMEVVYWNRTRLSAEEEAKLGVAYLPVGELLSRADFVSLHVAYTPDTHHLIASRELELMKSTAFLINSTRGSVVDEKALVTALQEGRIAGAGLDVYENEPELDPGLYELENAVLVPHLGSATVATRTRMGLLAAENLVAACTGADVPNPVNPEVLKR